MSITRANILKNATALADYCDGVKKLKNEFTGPTTKDLGISGAVENVSTYDLFVVWHVNGMMTMTPAQNNPEGRNAAHRGPVFPAWHRFMLRQLELNLQRVLEKSNFALPYWDWAMDGEGSPDDQLKIGALDKRRHWGFRRSHYLRSICVRPKRWLFVLRAH